MRWPLLAIVGLIVVAGGVFLALRSPSAQPVVISPPTSAPATAPATAPLPRPVEYMDVVRRNYPDFPATQPMIVPVAMNEAARLVIKDPVYLDRMGELWITRGDAEATSVVFKSVHERSTHVLREQVVFVHRWPDEKGIWQPQLICRKPGGGFQIVTASSEQDIEGNWNYQWNNAFEWNNAFVVPTDRGISVIRPDRRPMELHYDFVPVDQFDAQKYSPVQALLDWRGLIAWMPWDEGKTGSKGAVRLAKDKWAVLDSTTDWPDKLLHLIPLLDGSVLQLILNDDKTAEVRLVPQDPNEVDAKAIADLVDQLSDTEALKRDEAFGKLTRYGIGSWPVLEKLLPSQPPEARFRIEQLLSAKTQPMLGGMILQRGLVKVIARGEIGAALVYAEAGVVVPRGNDQDPLTIKPAWISLLPGQSITLAPPGFIDGLKEPGRQLSIVGGEWFVEDEKQGPIWWLSNHFTPPLLKPAELNFRKLIGMDGRGRWLFREHVEDSSPTLILDPTLPDQTPKLPIWVYTVDGGEVGWSKDNWPAIKLGGAWALINGDWQPIDDDKFITKEPPMPGMGLGRALSPPILVEKNGTRFYDGLQTIEMVAPDGKQLKWKLPDEAVGMGYATMVRAGEDRLFLFNASGRIIRLKQTPDKPEPFKLEAIFTRHTPNVPMPQRIWVDPAGRIVVAYGGNSMAICFPNGRIPPDIVNKMTAKDLQDADDQ
ncbi:MAG TPA: hypothetical protein VHD56_15050 [Tepidisphaeraceae bacterium]|nr:hypothetical protein [Tepidisphaeraceae bacterium]